MNQRMCGDIQRVQDGGPVDVAVGSIRRKADAQDPRDFEATASSADVSKEDIQQMLADLQMKQMGYRSNETNVYPYA